MHRYVGLQVLEALLANHLIGVVRDYGEFE